MVKLPKCLLQGACPLLAAEVQLAVSRRLSGLTQRPRGTTKKGGEEGEGEGGLGCTVTILDARTHPALAPDHQVALGTGGAAVCSLGTTDLSSDLMCASGLCSKALSFSGLCSKALFLWATVLGFPRGAELTEGICNYRGVSLAWLT